MDGSNNESVGTLGE